MRSFYPVLYNLLLNTYKDIMKKDYIWKKVAEIDRTRGERTEQAYFASMLIKLAENLACDMEITFNSVGP